MENPLENRAVKIETVTTPGGNQVSFCPERGGIITSIKFEGKEILYLDEATLEDRKINIKGGIPILFPNAGPLPEISPYPNLKQHGFARDSSNWKTEKYNNGFKETLMSSEETRKIFPYDFRFSLDASFEEDGSFTINQELENLSDNEDLPVSMGLHPYFKVSKEKKYEIKFNFEGGKFVEEQVEIWASGKAVSIDNPKVKNPNATIEVVIPSLGTLTIDASPEYKKIWVWSMSEKDFVCIEPVMRDKGGLVEDPEIIKPKETLRLKVNLSLKVLGARS